MKKILAVSAFLVGLAGCSSESANDPNPTTPDAAAGPLDAAAGPLDAGGATPSKPASRQPNTTGTGTYTGNATGFSVNVVDVNAYYKEGKPFDEPDAKAPFRGGLDIDLTDVAGLCADTSMEITRKGSHVIELEIRTYGATAEEATPKVGTYDLGAPGNNSAEIVLRTRDATCKSERNEPATDSSTVKRITFTEVSPTHIAGSYEVVNAGGTSISGTFEADVCTRKSQNVQPTCQ